MYNKDLRFFFTSRLDIYFTYYSDRILTCIFLKEKVNLKKILHNS